jgi:ComB9 competence protein
MARVITYIIILLSFSLPIVAWAQLGSVSSPAIPSPTQPIGLIGDVGRGGATQDINNLQNFTNGQFPDINRSSRGVLHYIQEEWNNPQAASGQIAPGVMRYIWRPDFIMPIRTREIMLTTIEFPPWEHIDPVVNGDETSFEIKTLKRNILLIRPRVAGADTNVTAFGASGNIYNFYVRSETWNSDQISDLTVYVTAPMSREQGGNSPSGSGINIRSSKMYGGGAAAGSGKKSRVFRTGVGNIISPPSHIREIAFKPENLQFDMKILAPNPEDIEIAPLRVFHDGIWTYFDYGDKADTIRRPVIFRVIDGIDTIVNTRTVGENGSIVIAEAVGDFTLKNGSKLICVKRDKAPRAFTGFNNTQQTNTSEEMSDASLFFQHQHGGDGQQTAIVSDGLTPQYTGGYGQP